MRKTAHVLWAVFFIAFLTASCKEEVDLYAENEVPVIYGLLDAKADTNFIRITRTFLPEDDPELYLSQHYDAICYPEKLDVRLVEFKNGNRTKEIILDTIHRQYYTVERLGQNTPSDKYSYELHVIVNGKEIVSKTDMVGGTEFEIVSPHLNFSLMYFQMEPRKLRFFPADNAGFYDVKVLFHYWERRLPSTDTVGTTFVFIDRRFDCSELSFSDGSYYIGYMPEWFYTLLGEYLGNDTLNKNVYRYITDYPIEVRVEAGGYGLMYYQRYYETYASTSESLPDFDFVGEGAVGLFSSRSRTSARGRLAGSTVPDLLGKNWGFKYIGGKE